LDWFDYFGLGFMGLFGILWNLAVWDGYGDRFEMLKYQVPVLVGGIVFENSRLDNKTLQAFNWFFDCLFKRISNVT